VSLSAASESSTARSSSVLKIPVNDLASVLAIKRLFVEEALERCALEAFSIALDLQAEEKTDAADRSPFVSISATQNAML